MHQLIVDLTNRIEKLQDDNVAPGEDRISREEIQEAVLGAIEANVTFLKSEVALLPMTNPKVARELQLQAFRSVMEEVVDRPHLAHRHSEVIRVMEGGLLVDRQAVAVTVALVHLSPKPLLRGVESSPAEPPKDPAPR